MVAAAIRTIFAKPDAEHVREQLDTIAAMLGRQLSRLLFVFGDLDDPSADLESPEQKSVTATAADDTWTPQQMTAFLGCRAAAMLSFFRYCSTMAVKRAELAAKLAWVEDNIASMDGRTPLRFTEALVRMSGGPGGRLVVNDLSEADAEELDGLCDELARENGHEWGPISGD
jgi:hypothetical protein